MGQRLFHLSEKNLNGVILEPRIPNNKWTRNGHEENSTPRVSFSTSIVGALMGITGDLTNKEFYVHEVDETFSKPEIKRITNKEVPDQFITDEIWVLNKVKLKMTSKIKVTKTFPKLFKQGRGSMMNNTYEWQYVRENSLRGDEKMEKSQDFILLEKCFTSIKSKDHVDENLARISTILKRSFDLTFEISIVDNDTHQFFGMSIYPSQSTIDSMIASMLSDKPRANYIVELWQRNTRWYLEIDSILLYDRSLNANPAEIVAVMLHEIGHVVYSNSVPQRVNKIVRYQMMQANYTVKKLAENWKIRKIFGLVIAEACSTKNFNYINKNKERIADQFVVKMGYGDELNQFISKLIASQGNKLVNRTNAEIDTDIRAVVNWSIENIAELEFRKKKLKTTIQTELLKNPSNFIKSIVENIKDSFFGGNESEGYKEMVAEQYLMEEYRKIVQESVLDWFDSIGKVKKVSQSDIDYIGIEVDKIENNDDRIYVLDLIYDKYDLINTALSYIEKGKTDKVAQSKQTLMNFKSQLDKMRDRVINMQIKDKQYGVFIKYPKGYEG